MAVFFAFELYCFLFLLFLWFVARNQLAVWTIALYLRLFKKIWAHSQYFLSTIFLAEWLEQSFRCFGDEEKMPLDRFLSCPTLCNNCAFAKSNNKTKSFIFGGLKILAMHGSIKNRCNFSFIHRWMTIILICFRTKNIFQQRFFFNFWPFRLKENSFRRHLSPPMRSPFPLTREFWLCCAILSVLVFIKCVLSTFVARLLLLSVRLNSTRLD